MASFQNIVGSIFGFDLKKKKPPEEQTKSFATPQEDDGAVTVQSGSYYGTYVDLDGVVRNEVELITRYRDMAMQPEIESAIDDIVNEAVIRDETTGKIFDLNMDELKQPESIKKKINEELDNLLKLLNFSDMGHDIFKRWYVDGRLYYHIIIDEKNPAAGIQELRIIDPRRIRKVREIVKTKDVATGLEVIKEVKEYYLYNERGIVYGNATVAASTGQRISVDSIANVNSGLLDSKRAMVLSYLHKAIKPLNQLRMVEDATVIYRLARAPERRVFYIDVGNMPTIKAEQYLRDIMVKYKNKLVYDANTGEIRDDRKYMSMLEDFWLPRREGGKGTQIETLPGGQNLGQIQDVEYFEKKLYKALGVPFSRTQPQTGFSLGKSQEITRDEIKFAKFIDRLRNKFSGLFDVLLRVQLSLKGIASVDDWKELQEGIFYNFLKDNNYEELKNAELNTTRLGLLMQVDPFRGIYYSKEWIQKNVLNMTEDEIKEIDKQIEKEQKEELAKAPKDINGNPLPIDPKTGAPMADPNMPPGGAPPDPDQGMQQLQSGPGQEDMDRASRYRMSNQDMKPGK